MKLKLSVLVFMMIGLNALSQKKVQDVPYYEASNGITYKKGDKIKLRWGTGSFGNFKSVAIGKGYGSGSESSEAWAGYSNFISEIKAIKRWNISQYQGVVFYITGYPLYGSSMAIEKAIENCEIYNCKKGEEEFVFDNSYKSKEKYEKINEYTASNGVTYKIGDVIKLNKGSSLKGDFVYLSDSKNGVYVFDPSTQSKGKRMGQNVTIERIKKYNTKNSDGVYFSLNVKGRSYNSILDIEGALYSCEVGDCVKKEEIPIANSNEKVSNEAVVTKPSFTSSSEDKYDQLRKVKKLYDEGILTEEEYLAEKKKILAKD